jgi:hypothetical protein
VGVKEAVASRLRRDTLHRMALVKTALNLSLVGLLAATVFGCSKSKDESPPPMPTATEPTAAPPPTAVAPVELKPADPTPLAPGQLPASLGQAIDLTRPQMKDSTTTPDDGSATLLKYWLAKAYPWAQLEAVPLQTAAAFLAAPDTGRGKRICGAGLVQTFAKTTTAAPHEYEGTLATAEGEILSYGAVADVAGVAPNAKARFCGISSGIQTITNPAGAQVRAIRVVGMFDTPANRGGGGGGFSSLRACCMALQQNSKSMPPPNNLYAASAATYCLATVASISNPQQKDAMLAGIRSALRGAPMPSVCR